MGATQASQNISWSQLAKILYHKDSKGTKRNICGRVVRQEALFFVTFVPLWFFSDWTDLSFRSARRKF